MTNQLKDDQRRESPTYRGRVRDGFAEVWREKGTKVDSVPFVYFSSPAPGRRDDSFSLPGFAWGYGGGAPAQLALALLVDAVGDKDIALGRYREFKRDYVANWGNEWRISASEIREFAASRPKPPRTLFLLGEVLVAPAVWQHLDRVEIICGLQNHLDGDWGEVDRDAWMDNCDALVNGRAIVSRYNSLRGGQFVVTTGSDRIFTTIMLYEP